MVKPKENKMREIKEFIKSIVCEYSYFTSFDNYVYYFVFHVCKNILMPTTHLSISKLLGRFRISKIALLILGGWS